MVRVDARSQIVESVVSERGREDVDDVSLRPQSFDDREERFFRSAVPTVESPGFYRYPTQWQNEYVQTWLQKQRNIVKILEAEPFDVYRLGPEVLQPAVFVPKNITNVQGNVESILDGIVASPADTNGFTTRNDDTTNAHRVVIPLQFTNDSSSSMSHHANTINAEFTVPKEGDYQMLFYRRSANDTSSLPAYSLDRYDADRRLLLFKKTEKSSPTLHSENPSEIGSVHLLSGRHSVQFGDALNQNNTVVDPTVTSKIWEQNTYDCSVTGDATVYTRRDERKGTFLEIDNKKNGACRSIVVGGLRTNQKYLFSFEYKHVSGSELQACVQLDDRDDCLLPRQTTQLDDWWHRSEMVYEQGDNSRASIRVNVPGEGIASQNYITNVELREAEIPSTVAFAEDVSAPTYSAHSVEYRRLNPTLYQVILHQASGKVPVVLNEAYHPGWKVYVKRADGEITTFSDIGNFMNSLKRVTNKMLRFFGLSVGERLPQLVEHQQINGTQNLWYFPATREVRDYELIIEFRPQIFYAIGQLTALVTVGALVVIGARSIFVTRSRRRHLA